MDQLEIWPPPEWEECVISWERIFEQPRLSPNNLYEWCAEHPSDSRFHVHGWESTEGFAFRFENPADALLFKLRWE